MKTQCFNLNSAASHFKQCVFVTETPQRYSGLKKSGLLLDLHSDGNLPNRPGKGLVYIQEQTGVVIHVNIVTGLEHFAQQRLSNACGETRHEGRQG